MDKIGHRICLKNWIDTSQDLSMAATPAAAPTNTIFVPNNHTASLLPTPGSSTAAAAAPIKSAIHEETDIIIFAEDQQWEASPMQHGPSTATIFRPNNSTAAAIVSSARVGEQQWEPSQQHGPRTLYSMPPVTIFCPNNHTACLLPTPGPGHCDSCRNPVNSGTPMYSCRICNWDACEACCALGNHKITETANGIAETYQQWAKPYPTQHVPHTLYNTPPGTSAGEVTVVTATPYNVAQAPPCQSSPAKDSPRPPSIWKEAAREAGLSAARAGGQQIVGQLFKELFNGD